MYIIAKQASIQIEHTPVYGYHHHLSFYKLSSTIKWNLLYQARQRSSVQVDRLKGGCTIFDVEHMSCSLEFWTQKSKKKLQTIFLTDLWPLFDYIFLLPIWKCTVKLARPIELKFSGSSKGWKILSRSDTYGRLRPKMTRKIRNTYIGCTFSKWQ